MVLAVMIVLPISVRMKSPASTSTVPAACGTQQPAVSFGRFHTTSLGKREGRSVGRHRGRRLHHRPFSVLLVAPIRCCAVLRAESTAAERAAVARAALLADTFRLLVCAVRALVRLYRDAGRPRLWPGSTESDRGGLGSETAGAGAGAGAADLDLFEVTGELQWRCFRC